MPADADAVGGGAAGIRLADNLVSLSFSKAMTRLTNIFSSFTASPTDAQGLVDRRAMGRRRAATCNKRSALVAAVLPRLGRWLYSGGLSRS